MSQSYIQPLFAHRTTKGSQEARGQIRSHLKQQGGSLDPSITAIERIVLIAWTKYQWEKQQASVVPKVRHSRSDNSEDVGFEERLWGSRSHKRPAGARRPSRPLAKGSNLEIVPVPYGREENRTADRRGTFRSGSHKMPLGTTISLTESVPTTKSRFQCLRFISE